MTLPLGLQSDGSFVHDVAINDGNSDLEWPIKAAGFTICRSSAGPVVLASSDFQCNFLPHPDDDDDDGFSVIRMHWIPLNDGARLWLSMNAPHDGEHA